MTVLRSMNRMFPIVVALFTSMSASCILSEPARFEPPPNSPPSIDTTATPTARIFRSRTTDVVVGGDGGASNSFEFNVTVVDSNVDQELEYRVYVDYDPSSPTPSLAQSDIPRVVSGDRTRRQLTFTIPRPRDARCHWVELFVTSDFATDRREPAMPGDIASATWFIMTTTPDNQIVDVTTCLQQIPEAM